MIGTARKFIKFYTFPKDSDESLEVVAEVHTFPEPTKVFGFREVPPNCFIFGFYELSLVGRALKGIHARKTFLKSAKRIGPKYLSSATQLFTYEEAYKSKQFSNDNLAAMRNNSIDKVALLPDGNVIAYNPFEYQLLT
jgi:hypothetical protein